MIRLAARLFAAAALIAAAAIAQNHNYQPDSHWSPPPDAASRPNPLAAKPQAEAGGRKIFMRECAACHGQDGSGIRNAANLRLRVVQDQTDGALFWKITTGNASRGMPSWSRLPEMQRWQLVLFLRMLK